MSESEVPQPEEAPETPAEESPDAAVEEINFGDDAGADDTYDAGDQESEPPAVE